MENNEQHRIKVKMKSTCKTDDTNHSQIDPLPTGDPHIEKCHPKIHLTIRTDYVPIKDSQLTLDQLDKKENENHRPLFSPKFKSNFITVKTSMKSILKDYDINFPKINNLVIECHEIVTRTFQFIRLYLLYKYNQIQNQLHDGLIESPPDTLFPVLTKIRKGKTITSSGIDIDIILYFMRACGINDPRGKKVSNNQVKTELEEFYEQHFRPYLNKDKFNLINKTYITTYLSQQIQTGFNNNIKQHFLTRIRRLMNLLNPYPGADKKLFGKIKNLILLDQYEKIPIEYQPWSQMIKDQYLPKKYDVCYGYDVKIVPEKYLYYMIKMNETIEQMNKQIRISQLSDEQKRIQSKKLFQPIPLRTTFIPCYMTLDANGILSQFFDSEESQLKNHTSENSNYIWSKLFKTDKKIMKKKGYQFHSIQTDGIGVSICFQKNGCQKNRSTKQIKDTDVYIDDLTEDEIAQCLTRKLVGCDPNKYSLGYFMDDQKKHLRYTSGQRCVESQQKRCKQITMRDKLIHHIQEEEQILSNYNYHTVDFLLFQQYIQTRTLVNDRIQSYYQQELYRKMKWRVYIDRRKSEDHFLNRIESTYGSSQDILICHGDWSQHKQMKHIMPTLGVGFRRIIKRKFNLVLVDEWGSSKYCSLCHHELDHYNNSYRLLVCPECKNSRLATKMTCFFNRDANASMNLLYLSHEWLDHRTRPVPYNRSHSITDSDLARGKPVCQS